MFNMRNNSVIYDMKKIWTVIEKHLDGNYRDPKPRPLPPVEPGPEDSVICIANNKKEDSVKEVISNTLEWDTMMEMGILRKKHEKTYADLRNIQREFYCNRSDISKENIRRLIIPARKYVLLELKEGSYSNAAKVLQQLMDEHDKMRESIPPEQLIDKPLKDKSKSIIFLGEILKQANIHRDEKNFAQESSLYYHTARHYETKNNTYWTWLANAFYKLALEAVNDFDKDGGYSEALINYMYGRFLLLTEKDAISAMTRLQTAFNKSKGKPWGAMWATNISFEKINEYSSYLLHIAQLEVANKISSCLPALAIKYSLQAVRHARRGKWHPDLEEAMMELAINYTKNKNHDEAISVLIQLNDKITPKENKDLYISIQVLLALCYKRARRKEQAIKQLYFLVELGKKWDIPELVAFGHKYIARYLMEKGKVVSAREFLVSCILHYKKQQNYKELLESVYLHGYSKAIQHLKEYIELMVVARTPETPEFKKLLNFLSYGKPFWEEKKIKRYIVTKTIGPHLSQKEVLTAADKIYLLLKEKLGEKFADYAKEEITKFGKNPFPGDLTNHFHENPTEVLQYFNTRKEAENQKKFLKKKYEKINKMMNEKYGKNIYFEIETREIEDKAQETEYINSLNKIDPIIPYAKESPLYKQALDQIQNYLQPQNLGKPDNIYIDITDPKILIRLLNTIVTPGKVLLRFKGDINIEAILAEKIKQRNEQKAFVESLPDTLEKRFSTEIPYSPKLPKEYPPEDRDDKQEYESDEYIEKNRDILFNKNKIPILQ